MSVLQPAGTFYLKDTLLIKYEVNINNTHIPEMKGIRNTKGKGAALFLPFPIGGHYDSAYPFGYHLQFNDTDGIPGTSNTGFEPFCNWLAESKYYVCLSTEASHTAKLAPSSSS